MMIMRALKVILRNRLSTAREALCQLRHQVKWHGQRVMLSAGVKVICPERIIMGHDVLIANRCWVQAAGGLTIGNRVMLGPNVQVLTSNHDVETLLTVNAPIVLEDEVWIGAGATLLPGVRVGQGSVVAAGAVVNRDVPPFTVVGGVPARVLKELDLSKKQVSYFDRAGWKQAF